MRREYAFAIDSPFARDRFPGLVYFEFCSGFEVSCDVDDDGER